MPLDFLPLQCRLRRAKLASTLAGEAEKDFYKSVSPDIGYPSGPSRQVSQNQGGPRAVENELGRCGAGSLTRRWSGREEKGEGNAERLVALSNLPQCPKSDARAG